MIRRVLIPSFARSLPPARHFVGRIVRRPFSASASQVPASKVLHRQAEDFKRAQAALSGIPEHLLMKRQAIIYRPAKHSMQSGTGHTHQWRLKFDAKNERWTNPLMGWTSSDDPLGNLELTFSDCEAAEQFCSSHGYSYEIKPEHKVPLKPKSYAHNFAYVPPQKDPFGE